MSQWISSSFDVSICGMARPPRRRGDRQIGRHRAGEPYQGGAHARYDIRPRLPELDVTLLDHMPSSRNTPPADELDLRPLTARSVVLSTLLGSHPPLLP